MSFILRRFLAYRAVFSTAIVVIVLFRGKHPSKEGMLAVFRYGKEKMETVLGLRNLLTLMS